MIRNKEDAIISDTFYINGNPHAVWLYQHQLTWCPQRPGGKDMSEWMSVKLHDIFSAEIEEGINKSDQCCMPSVSINTPTDFVSPSNNLIIFYAKQKIGTDEWECEAVKCVHADLDLLNTWLLKIQALINEMKHRPKRVLIFLNPFGGKRKALSIFDNFVKPILNLGRVTYNLITTEYQNHALETLLSFSTDKLLEYDVVVAIGGDGTACEIVTGLLRRSAETSASNKDTTLQPSLLSIGVIPAGSSNALAYSVHGTDEPTTAAIHLVLGGKVPLDVGAIHTDEGIAKFFVTQMSYGHLADTLKKSDKLRWMGPKRYDYAGLCKFLNNKSYEGSLDLRVSLRSEHKAPTECLAGNNCSDCRGENEWKEDIESEWIRIEGNFLGISVANLSCRCSLCPRGLAPFAHISDGYLDIIVVRKASRTEHLKYLIRTSGDSRTVFTLPFVERYRVKEMIFNPKKICMTSASSVLSTESLNAELVNSSHVSSYCVCDSRTKKHSFWNCDGELLRRAGVRVKVYAHLIRIMARSAPPLLRTQEYEFHESSSSSFPPLPSDIPII